MAVKASDLCAEDIRRFTMDGRVDWRPAEKAADQSTSEIRHPAHKIRWAIEQTQSFECGHYGAVDAWVYLALERYPIRGKTVGVIGSADQGHGPWYEAMVLSSGGNPITVEYNPIRYEHPRMTAWSPKETVERISAGFRFDALLCVSSVEHDGLTRYGDPLNPDADLEAMKTFRSYLKTDGLLYLTCPVGRDRVLYNYHRIYGKVRFPLLVKDWLVVDTFGFRDIHLERDVQGGWRPEVEGKPLFRHYPSYEPVFVLRNIAPL